MRVAQCMVGQIVSVAQSAAVSYLVQPTRTAPRSDPAMNERTLDANRKCAEWLAACLGFGWNKADLDFLEHLWWLHHDRFGHLSVTTGRARRETNPMSDREDLMNIERVDGLRDWPSPRSEPASLDCGIRDTVEMLQRAAFLTTDSGDGVSKPEDERVWDIPHVAAVVAAVVMVSEAERMAALLGQEWHVQATYSTADKTAVLLALKAPVDG
eukprot:GHVR01103441.1.p1 GENE.GHVR01103441.1~~GHVR01103441.1.p1  ORF type:complete len:212 (-),score=34.80 GHVR01103441.1:351-986(-)